jgi:zinc protease
MRRASLCCLVFVATMLAAGSASARAQALTKPDVGPEKPFAPPPRVERTLANGLRVVAVRYGTVPKLSAILTVKAGLAVDPADKAGLAQLVAEAAQEGTSTRSSEQIKREVFALGAALSGAAGQDSTSFQMRGLAETLPQMLALLADVVRNATFPEAEVDLIKTNTAQQLQAQMASPQFVANKLFRQSLFGSHPYARTGVTPETLPAIDRAVLVEYHKTYYRPNHSFLVIVGEAAPEAVFAAAEKAFGGWVRGEVPATKASPLPALQGRRLVFVQRPNSVQSSISVGNFSIRRDDERWYTLQLSNQIFGAAFDSRLVRNIREEKGYTYSPGSIFQAMAEGGFYRAVADVRNDVTGATIKEIYGEIDKLRAGGPETEELSDAKQYSRGVFLLQNATQNGFAGTINTVNTFGLAKDYPENFQRLISQPSAEAVKTGAEMLLGSQDSVVVIVGDYTKVKEQLTGFSNITFVDLAGKPISEPR